MPHIRGFAFPLAVLVLVLCAPMVLAAVPPATTPAPNNGTMTITGNPANGAVLFSKHCTACHGVRGAGRETAPRLKALRDRRSIGAAIIWIKSPQPPMPKLYPKPLSDRDVNDLVLYLETL